MRKYSRIHEEHNVTPLTLSINHFGMDAPLLRRLLKGRNVGQHPFCEYRGYAMKFYVDKDKWFAVSRYIVDTIKKDSHLANLVYGQSLRVGEKILKVIQSRPAQNLDALTRAQLARLLRTVFSWSVDFCAYGYIPALSDFNTFYFSNLLEKIIGSHEKICRRFGQTPAGVLSLLTTSVRPYPADRARAELLKLTRQTRTPASKNGAVKQWLRRWYWLTYGHLGPGWTRQTLAAELRTLDKQKGDVARRALKKEQAKWFSRLKLTKNEARILRVAQEFVFLKGYRAEITAGVYALFQQAAALAAKRSGIKQELLRFTALKELLTFLSGKKPVSVSALRARRKFSLWRPISLWSWQIFTGKQARDYIKRNAAKEEAVAKVDVLTGQVAFTGRVVGRVLIINEPADMKKVRGPFVLVSEQTNPELVPAMKKALAFVTDHGGITSHASIVAREMKKPCVIGTRLATKVLKDGDLVEVDAEKGIVKKL